ncbi:hypothetical protein WJX74_007953 [Apatococcus lobatus]|uniref:CENP-V/GFA domain-containing protein n=1 Tax=Apatococcus lobatus TaxID=904363 RepID=A0AAW1SB44_9CHLO
MNNGSGVRRLKSRIVRGFKATLRKCFWNGFKAWKRQLGRGGPLPTAYGLKAVSDPASYSHLRSLRRSCCKGRRSWGKQVMALAITGQCLCGALKYKLETAPLPKMEANYCHCTQCRRATGAQLGTFVMVPRPAFLLTGSTLKRFQSSSHAHRAFCSECGSHIFYDNEDSPSIDVYVGTLDHPEQVEPDYHLFCCKGIIPVNEAVQKYNENGPKE